MEKIQAVLEAVQTLNGLGLFYLGLCLVPAIVSLVPLFLFIKKSVFPNVNNSTERTVNGWVLLFLFFAFAALLSMSALAILLVFG